MNSPSPFVAYPESKPGFEQDRLHHLEPNRRDGPPDQHLRWLAPAMMWAELEHCRKISDLVEEPFSLLVCTSRAPLSAKFLPSSSLVQLNEFSDVLGPIGLLDRKQLGLVIRTRCEDDLCKFAQIVQEMLGNGPWEFQALTYPFSLDQDLPFEDSWGGMSSVMVGSLQPLFALPTPWGKRLLDVTVAALGLLILLPLFLVVAALIRWTSAGPIFFKQRRVGLGGIPFDIYKFRTMVVDAEQQQNALKHLNEQDGPAFKMRVDPRVTNIGRLLRFTCVDELPQLWNVLRGDMSLVGPRPLPCDEANACRWWQRRRLDVLPGVTCTWQARGRSMVSFDEWMRLDLEYVRRRSLAFDFHIVLCTIAFLVSRSTHESHENHGAEPAQQRLPYTT